VRPTLPGPSREDRHRALSNRTRTRLLGILRERAGGCDARGLAQELGLHVNTVRSHLAILEGVQLVTSAPESRQARGRPRLIFRAATADDGTSDEYRFLATVLASSITTDTHDAGRRAQQAGERWGEHLVDRPPPGRPGDADEVLERAVALLDDLGFAPRPDPGRPGRIELHRCPFRGLAVEHTDVVCGVHLGILRGALAQAGGPTEAISLSPFVTETMCLAEIDVA
jgi:predicted ArsR family transcriptional regulator